MLNFPIYLDNHSTTQIDPAVVEAMLPFFTEHYGNPSSKYHKFGWIAEATVEQARSKISEILNCLPNEIIFTSGATESNNLAIRGIIEVYSSKGKHIITSEFEHPSVLEVFKFYEKKGFKVTYLKPTSDGFIKIEQVKDAIRKDTILVSIIWANNEIGTIQPIDEIAQLCDENGILFHTDGVQALGKIKIDLTNSKIHLASFNAHKLHGPKGIGFLYIKKKFPQIRILPIFFGGGQEKGLRSGTLNVPLIVGLSKCIEIAYSNFDENSYKMKYLRDKLFFGLKEKTKNIEINGSLTNRLPNNLNIRIPDIHADLLFAEIKEIAFSTGSACLTEKGTPSHVLKAIGLSDEQINSSIRFGISRFNTEEEIDYTINKFSEVIKKIIGSNYEKSGRTRFNYEIIKRTTE